MPQQTIIFDLDGVLVGGWHHRADRRKEIWFATMQEDIGLDPQRFIKAYYGTAAEHDVLTGRFTLKQAFDALLPQIGYDGQSSQFIAYWMKKNSTLNGPLVQAVRALKETGSVRLAVASNNEHTRMDHLMNRTALRGLFDHVFFAAAMGEKKPDQAFFQACNKRMGFTKEAAPLFFDDNPEIVAGACAAGWDGVVYNDLEDFVNHPRIAPKLQAACG